MWQSLKSKSNLKFLGIFFILLIPSFWALFVPGYFGASDDLHIAWLYEMDKLLSIGQIPPRFVPDLSFGFGYPLFNFVFPLPFYLGEIIHKLGFNFVDSVKGVFFLSIIFSSVFMYLFLKLFLNRGFSLAGAILYVYTPYRAVDLYIRGAIGEILSFVFLPLIILSLLKIIISESIKEKLFYSGVGGLALSLLVLSHDITTYMFIPYILFLGIIFIFSKQNLLKNFLTLALMGILALLISSYFWLPALLDSTLMKYDTVFNFLDHYPTLKQLFVYYWGYGASVPGPYDGMSFYLGTVNILILIGGIVLAILNLKKLSNIEKKILIWGGVSFIVTIFMMNYRSELIWKSLPFVPYFQFPWRFLMMITLITPIFLIPFKYLKFKKFVPVLIIFLTIATSFWMFRPQDFLGRTDSYYLNKYIPLPITHSDYLLNQEEYLRLPKETQMRPSSTFPLAYVDSSKEEQIDKISSDSLNSKIRVISPVETSLNYSKYYFPGWSALIDGKVAQIKPGLPYGQITTQVPSGTHTLEFKFSENLFKLSLDILSLVSLMGAIVLIWSFKPLTKK